jgi:hypothetical protein
MNVVQLLLVLRNAISKLESMGCVTTDYKLVFNHVNQWAELGVAVETSLKGHGVTVQEDVDRIIQALPLLLSLVGVK